MTEAEVDRRRERIEFVYVLLGVFLELYKPGEDEDADGTAEMVRECRALADELRAELPPLPPCEPAVDDDSIPY